MIKRPFEYTLKILESKTQNQAIQLEAGNKRITSLTKEAEKVAYFLNLYPIAAKRLMSEG